MKYLLIVCSLLISIPVIAGAQQRGNPRSSLTVSQTKEAERRLNDMGYWTGPVDGVFDPATRSAVIAFQKYEGRPINGRLTLDELDALRAGTVPEVREPGYAHVEVDVDRQVMLMVNDHGRVRVLPVST